MKKFIKFCLKWIIRIVVISVVLVSLTLYFLYQPSIIFKHSIEHNHMFVYSDSPILPENLLKIDKAFERVSGIEIYNPNYKPDIYLITDRGTYEIFATLTLKNKYSQGINLTVFENVFINMSQVKDINLNHDPEFTHTHLAGDLDQVLAHEFIHGYITERIGWLNQFYSPRWKIEGYCEYGSTISQIKKDRKATLLKRAQPLYSYDIQNYTTNSAFYYRSQLLVEYLFEVHGINFDQLLENPVTFESLSTEFDDWYYLKAGLE